MLDRGPERAHEVLCTTEQSRPEHCRRCGPFLGYSATTETGMRRTPAWADPRTARDDGLDIKIEESSPAASLPSSVERAAYRILRESLIKRDPSSSARIAPHSDFDANPNVDPAVIHTLVTCDWVRKGLPLCLIGDSGTGNSHLLIALGAEAASQVTSRGTPAVATTP